MKPATLLVALALALASSPSGVSAQELQAFELDDFLDPRLLTLEGDDGEQENVSFFASRWFLGFLDNYQRRDQVTGTGFTFARATGSFYRGRNQFTLEATDFERLGLNRDRIGELRFEFGRYFFTEDPDTKERMPARVLVSWRTTSGEEEGFEDEISLMVDLTLPVLDTEARVYGGYVLTHVPDRQGTYLSYVFRSQVHRWQNGIALDAGFGLGAEHVDDSFRWGHSRLELSLLLPTKIFNSYLHLLAAPYYHPHPPDGVDSFDMELGIFIDSSAFSHIFEPKKRR